MITGELSAAVAAAAEAVRAAGELAVPPLTSGAALAGTWRPVPAVAGGGPGSYASTIPFLLASQSAGDPAQIAAVLAARVLSTGAAAGICRAVVTGPGYLSLTVSPEALGRLAARISQAGPGCARSAALRGTTVTAPAGTSLAAAGSWDEAWQRLAAELVGRLASAAGAEVKWTGSLSGSAIPEPGPLNGPATPEPGPVAAAEAFGGTDAIRYALSRAVPSGTGPAGTVPSGTVPTGSGPSSTGSSRTGSGRRIRAIDPRAAAAQHLGNPFYAVRYAHAHAVSILRWSADLGLPAVDAAQFQPRLLAHPREQALLDAMSWLPERVAGAARRGQPHVLAGYLEELSGTYLDWQECCPLGQPGAFPPGPDRAAETQLRQARLMLADAARTVLGTGLELLGVAAPGGAGRPGGAGQPDESHLTSKEA